MPAVKGSGKLRERLHLQAVLSPLVNSMRGQILLVNLHAGMKLLRRESIKNALLSIRVSDARRMHEDDYLPHLKLTLQNPSFGLMLQHRVSSLAVFASDSWIINVLPLPSYVAYYEDPSTAMSGHLAFNSKAGNIQTKFKPSASTAPAWWIAGRESVTPSTIAKSSAQESRDILGLVHYGDNVDLVSMHLELPGCDVYRPTFVEANPNARFRHINPNAPRENRWGGTVHLGKLRSFRPGDDIHGVPELVAAQVKLSNCRSVEFYFLGNTGSDRSTTSMDRRFLDIVIGKRKPVAIKNSIIRELLK